MMRRLLLFVVILAALAMVGGRVPARLYDFTLNRIDGQPESMGAYSGQVMLLVNVASKCGFTPQYEGLEALYSEYRSRGFVVLGFPANDFGAQEPGSNAEIAEFCRATWSVKFPMFEKLSVVGEGKHPLYEYLTSAPPPIGGEIEWNFQKFLVDRSGEVVARYSPRTRPKDPALVKQIEALLSEGATKSGNARN